jgi:hypothetical protein
MSFCKICSNLYNIGKALDSAVLQKGGKLSEDAIIQNILDGQIINPSILQELKLDKLVKNTIYAKLSQVDKEYVYNLIAHTHEQPLEEKGKDTKEISDNNTVYYYCQKCGFSEKLQPQTLIFSNITDNTLRNVINDNYTNLKYDNTLPRTRNYNCHNKKCETHKNKKIKEAVFYRQYNSYITSYVCTVCNTKWTL